MIESMTHAVKLSELRSAINDHDGEDTEALGALENEHKAIEIKYRSAVKAEAAAAEVAAGEHRTNTPEGREVLELRERSTLAGFVQGFHTGKLEGPEAEFRSAVLGDGFKPDHVPLEMLMPRGGAGLETRAVTTVDAAAQTEGNQQTIAARVFNRSIPALLGIPMPSVPAGKAGYPRLTGGTTFSMQAKSGEQAAVAGTFGGAELSPLRGTGSYEFRVEDVAELIGIEDAMREDLRGGMENLMSIQVANGNGTAPNVEGIRDAVSATPTTNPGNFDTFTEMVERFMGEVDGVYANGPGDMQLVMRSDIFQYMASTFATNDDSVSAYNYLASRVGGITVNNTIPAKSGNDIGTVIVYKAGANTRAAVLPVWNAFSLLVDPYSLSLKGEVRLTAAVIFNFKVLDVDAFAVKKVRTAA